MAEHPPVPGWRSLLGVALLLGAIASGWSVWRHAHPGSDGLLATRSDYVLRDYEIVVLNPQGRESFTLRGPELLRNPADKTMQLATPQFLVPDHNGHYWDVRAQHGFVPAGGEQLQLRGKVRAVSPPQAPPPTLIETEWLALDLHRNRAATAAAVTVTRPGLTMRGMGLEADFDRQQVSLLSQVHARYAPQP